MEAELVAIDSTSSGPGRPEDQARGFDPTGSEPAQVIGELRDTNERVRNEIAEAAREATVAAATGDSDRNAIALLIG